MSIRMMLTALLAFSLLGLTACDEKKNDKPEGNTTAETTAQTETTPKETTPAEPEITETTPLDDEEKAALQGEYEEAAEAAITAENADAEADKLAAELEKELGE
ncbi:MAG: hypothetical protein VYE40_15260 [Myxococcota bacterium]|nr:hypothetical protein [Myxococcota bacterium]